MMKRKIFVFSGVLVSAFLLFLFSLPNLSGGQESVIKGSVVDKDGRSLKDAKIVFLDASRGSRFSTKSDKQGNFIKVGIPPGAYKVTVELENYFPFSAPLYLRFGIEESVKFILEKIPPRLDQDKDFEDGANLFGQKKFKEAIEPFKKSAEKFPDNPEVHYNLGLSYLKSGDIDNALISLEKALKLKPDILEAYFALGEAFFGKGDGEKALEAFNNAIKRQPDSARGYYNIGIIYHKNNYSDEAIRFFEKSIEINPKFSSAYYQAALAYVKKGDFKKAIALFEEFLKIEPDAPEASQVKTMLEELKKRIGSAENR